jgi:hypothetical protein
VEKYHPSRNSFFTTYVWRGHESLFPNAKLFEVHGKDDESESTSPFCPKCQELLEEWRKRFWEAYDTDDGVNEQ